MVCVYGDLAIVKVEVQFVNGVVNGVCFFLNGAQNLHYVICLSKTDTHKLLTEVSQQRVTENRDSTRFKLAQTRPRAKTS